MRASWEAVSIIRAALSLGCPSDTAVLGMQVCCVAILPTPLWPAGHLPRKGEISLVAGSAHLLRGCKAQTATLATGCGGDEGLISSLEGEMAGRPEGGAKE
ncbi:hypothetical protein GCM10010837_20450 [Aminobacter niigataensis]